LFERLLRKIVLQVMSYHDLGNEPEKVYHALVLGMLVWMTEHTKSAPTVYPAMAGMILC